MTNLIETLLFDDPSPEEREALRERFEDDPDLAEAWAHWCEVRSVFRERLQDRVSDRRLLVLYVLDEEGYDEALTASEYAALEAARDDIARAIEAMPALEQIVDRIREECTDFEAVWEAQVDAPPADAPTSAPRDAPASEPRTDRAPRAPDSQRDASPRWTRRFALASLVVGIAVGIVLFWWPDASTTVTVAEGEIRTIELGTGSTARLVGAARLTHPTSAPEDAPYQVTLDEGRAFFDVQRRTDSTAFVVNTPTATASVLGTQFGVTTRADTTEVVLASGTVRVGASETADDRAVVLEPGQKSWVTTGTDPAAPTPTDLTDALDWTGLFVFRSAPMETVADRLSRRYEVSVAVDEALGREPVTGTFEQDQPAEQVLKALAATLGAEVTRTDGGYRITP